MSSKDSRSDNYRKPPIEHQFKKGASGNRSGRPKKKAQAGLGAVGGGITDRLAAMALNEATRPVTVREGETTSKMPAMQALLRTMFRAAAKGDIKAARQLMDLIARAEGQRTAAAVEMLQYAAQYKEKYGPIFEQHEREGLDPPDIYPHPDDIITDETTGEVTIDGPTSKDQARAREAVRPHVLESVQRYFEIEKALEDDPTNKLLRRELKELKKYYVFLQRDAARNIRHRALQISRRTLQPKPPEPKDDTLDDA
ncbi:DUF5681 domain-containing protein [Bradyrhizobium sp. USDA 3364]